MRKDYFLIGWVAENGSIKKLGEVKVGKKLCLDADARATFPANKRGRDDLLKACRWIKNARVTPNYLDFQSRDRLLRGRVIRVIPIKAS